MGKIIPIEEQTDQDQEDWDRLFDLALEDAKHWFEDQTPEEIASTSLLEAYALGAINSPDLFNSGDSRANGVDSGN